MNNKYIPYIFFIILVPILLAISYLLGRFDLLAFAAVLGIAALIVVSVFVLKNPFWGAILLVYALPFERIPTLDIGLVTLKINQVVAGLMIVSWFLRYLLVKDRNKLSRYPIGWVLILFLLCGLISATTSYDTSRSVSVLVFTVFMAVASFVFTQLVNSQNRLGTIIKSLFIITALVSLFAIYQFFGDLIGLPESLTLLKFGYTKDVFGFPRIHAFSMEPLFFGNFLFMPLSLALSYYIFNIKINHIFRYVGSFIMLVLLCMVLGLSRGVYIGLVTLALAYAIFAARSVLKFKNVLYTIAAIVLVGLGTFLFLSYSHPDSLDRFISQATVEDFSTGESVQKRLSDFQLAIDYWQEKPIIGIGPGNYGPRFLDYPPHSDVTDWQTVNNQYIELLAEWGVIGLILFLIILVMLFWRTFYVYKRTKDPFLRATLFGATTALLAILVQYNFFSTIYIMHIWIYIGLLIAIQNIAQKSYEKI